MTIRCLVHFAQAHHEFRLPELHSIAELYKFQIFKPIQSLDDGTSEDWDPLCPFWIVDFEKEQHARALAERCILVKAVYEFYARGSTYPIVFEQTQRCRHLWQRYIENTSFRFTVSAYNHTIPLRRQKEVVETFSFMDFQGPIDLKTPELVLSVFEEYANRGTDTLRTRNEGDGRFLRVYFGRLIAEGKARPLIQTFDVKKRAYFGNTSMEAEISLLMANQTLSSAGKLIYDPFIGTGSMAYTVAHFGAFVFGSDIDGRQMRGKESKPGILRSAAQYGISQRIIDLCTFDITQNPLRCGGLFDAIITDPPYGVRAGAKRLGRKNTDKRAHKRDPDRETHSKTTLPYIPPTQPYELSALVSDLVHFARHLLKPGGRLVFFLPTVTDEYAEVDVQDALCEGMEVIANSLQDFGSWGRRVRALSNQPVWICIAECVAYEIGQRASVYGIKLITIKKVTTSLYPSPFLREDDFNGPFDKVQTGDIHVPAHKDFREKYFRGFKKEENVVTEKTTC